MRITLIRIGLAGLDAGIIIAGGLFLELSPLTIAAATGTWLFFYYANRLYDVPILIAKRLLLENITKSGFLNLITAVGIIYLVTNQSQAIMLLWISSWLTSWLVRSLVNAAQNPLNLPAATKEVRVSLGYARENTQKIKKQARIRGNAAYLAAKRVLDLSVAIGIGTLFSPFAALAALGIKLEDGGPLLFTQDRIGLNGELFRVSKFRTMTPEDSREGLKKQITATENDPRITKVGKILRTTHLDEYPQLWSVFKGDMSFVGPRPEQPQIARELEQKEPLYKLRYMAKPGMTGWATLDYLYAHTLEDHLRKLEYDLYYLVHRSFWMDLAITLKTPSYMLGSQGR